MMFLPLIYKAGPYNRSIFIYIFKMFTYVYVLNLNSYFSYVEKIGFTSKAHISQTS
jgi:hypothetical protein